VVAPGPSTVHVGSTPSAHVASVHWATSVHGSASRSHVSHWSATRGSAQTRNRAAAAPVEVSTVMEASSEGGGRQEAAGWAVEASTRAGSYRGNWKS